MLLDTLFAEREQFSKAALENCSKEVKAAKFAVGQQVSGVVKKILPYGSFVAIDGLEQIIGLITCHQSSGKPLKVGDIVDAKVLDYDSEKKIVDLAFSKVTGYTSKILKQVGRSIYKLAVETIR